jgi:Asp-tRNA(Asn)/Glu-tRNA(Gln) amidotransferase A subunit family amidase
MAAVAASPEGRGLSREAFNAQLDAKGIVLSPEEREDVYQLANWLSEGVTGLGSVVPHAEAAAAGAADLDIAEAGRRLRNGTLTSLALTRAVLARIAERDPTYLAFYLVAAERALDDARRADADLAAGVDRGPLHGIPVGLKDLIDVAGLPTTAGSAGRKGHIASTDAEVVRRLVEGGAVIVGKLATYEWGTVGPAWDTLYPPARNPWSLGHITGGSSSGCAVAVAAGQLRTTVGTDTGGSLRGPAAYCGVVGLKPTLGLVPTGGVLGMSPSMDHVGPMSASSAEAAFTLDVLAGRTGPESAAHRLGQPVKGLRLAYARDWFAHDPQTHPAVLAAMDEAASTFSELGLDLETVDLPDYVAIEVAAAAVLHAEGFASHAEDLASHPEYFGRRTFQSIVAGVAVTPEELAEARRAGHAFRDHLDSRIFSSFDALLTVCTLTPALPVTAFADRAAWTPMRTIGFSISGHPVLALPMGFADGLPLGMQLVGPYFGEARLCQLGDAFEHATDFSAQRPPPPR